MTDEELRELLRAFDSVMSYMPEQDPDGSLGMLIQRKAYESRKALRNYLISKGFEDGWDDYAYDPR